MCKLFNTAAEFDRSELQAAAATTDLDASNISSEALPSAHGNLTEACSVRDSVSPIENEIAAWDQRHEHTALQVLGQRMLSQRALTVPLSRVSDEAADPAARANLLCAAAISTPASTGRSEMTISVGSCMLSFPRGNAPEIEEMFAAASSIPVSCPTFAVLA